MSHPAASSPLLFGTRAAGDQIPRVPVILDHPDMEPVEESILMPFETGCNPHVAKVDVANVEWLVELGLLEFDSPNFGAFEYAEFEHLVGFVYRHESFEELLLATNYICALYFFDDMIDIGGSRIGADPELMRSICAFMRSCMHSGEPPDSSAAEAWPLPTADRHKLVCIGRGMADVTLRLRSLPSSPNVSGYLREMDEYLIGCVDEAEYRKGQPFASVAEYEKSRTKVSAVYPCIELGGLLRGLVPSAEARSFRPYRRMARNANLYVSYVNDLFSFKREHKLGECSNLVMVLQHTDGLTPPQAFRRACRIVDLVVLQYLDDKKQCAHLDPDAIAGMDVMESWMRGNYDWDISQTHRYVHSLSTHPVPAAKPD